MRKEHEQFTLMDINRFGKWLFEFQVDRRIYRIQNHHTWKPNYENFKRFDHSRLLEGMRRYHLSRGFSDIAQNITTFPDGMIAICRSLEKTPAGIKGANSGSICIEHVGNFNTGGDSMTECHKETIIQLNALLCKRFKINPSLDTLIYHHWWDLKTGRRKDGAGATKSCPGTNFFGGNKPWNCEEHFIPPIKQAIKQI